MQFQKKPAILRSISTVSDQPKTRVHPKNTEISPVTRSADRSNRLASLPQPEHRPTVKADVPDIKLESTTQDVNVAENKAIQDLNLEEEWNKNFKQPTKSADQDISNISKRDSPENDGQLTGTSIHEESEPPSRRSEPVEHKKIPLFNREKKFSEENFQRLEHQLETSEHYNDYLKDKLKKLERAVDRLVERNGQLEQMLNQAENDKNEFVGIIQRLRQGGQIKRIKKDLLSNHGFT